MQPRRERTVDISEDEAVPSGEADPGRKGPARVRRKLNIDIREDDRDVLHRFDCPDDMWPAPRSFDPCVDHRIQRDLYRTRHLGRARSPKIADQVRRGRRLDSANPRQPPRSASVQPPEEMSGEEPGGKGRGHEEP